MIKYRQFLSLIIMLFFCFFLLSACAFQKSDEELIEARVDSFLTAYNSGDLDAILECLDAKTRNEFKSAMAIYKAAVGAVPKVGGILGKIDLTDLFGISVGAISEDDILTVSDLTINIVSDKKATVDVTLKYSDKYSEMQDEAFFTMVKEKNDWFIKNLESK